MTITASELIESAYQNKITSWTADHCATCDYPIKFLFIDAHTVKHDPGCSCGEEILRHTRYESSSWQLVADWINQQTDEEKIKEIKTFWKI
jgi:hypothetical protein